MATRKQVLDAVNASAWAIERTVYGLSAYRITEHTTPSGIPENWWPQSTYTHCQFLRLTMSDGKIIAAFIRDDLYPWTETREVEVSFAKAIEFVSSPFCGC